MPQETQFEVALRKNREARIKKGLKPLAGEMSRTVLGVQVFLLGKKKRPLTITMITDDTANVLSLKKRNVQGN